MSELAWSLTEEKAPRATDGQFNGKGAAYHSSSSSEDRSKGLEMTRPLKGDERFKAFKGVLARELRLQDETEEELVASVLLDELAAPAARGAKRSAAVPLTLEVALLQDRRGVTGKKNPANIARILEQLYSLGGGKDSVAECWHASMVNAGSTGLPPWANAAFGAIVPAPFEDAAGKLRKGILSVPGAEERKPGWLGEVHQSPFSWFARNWYKLCHGGWIEAMPRRRWTDWASCVARTAIATGFLFEMHVARRLAAAIVAEDGDPRQAVANILADARTLLPWNAGLSRSASDVGPVINRLSGAGTASLDLLERLTSRDDSDLGDLDVPTIACFDSREDGLAIWLEQARAKVRGNDSVKDAVTEALSAGVVGGARNTRETIRYSLLDRGTSVGTDLYALLKSAGNLTWVEPGQEWLIVVASLCADKPGGVCRLGDLKASLAELGISASTPTVISLLEKYGMARSSHDADDALEIQAGF